MRPEMRDESRRTKALSAEYRHALHRSTFSFKPDLSTPPFPGSSSSSFPDPKCTPFSPPFPPISQYYRPSCRRRRRTRPRRPLLLRFPRPLRQRLRLAALRSPRRSLSLSPSEPLPCCLPGPRLRKVCLVHGAREIVHGDRNRDRRGEARKKKKLPFLLVNSLGHAKKKRNLLLLLLFLTLASFLPFTSFSPGNSLKCSLKFLCHYITLSC